MNSTISFDHLVAAICDECVDLCVDILQHPMPLYTYTTRWNPETEHFVATVAEQPAIEGHGSTPSAAVLDAERLVLATIRAEEDLEESPIEALMAEVAALKEQLAALNPAILQERNELRRLLGELISVTSCRLDHHGNCQEHGAASPPCPTRQAQEILAPYWQEIRERS